jgi:ribonuclease P protein component
MRGSLRNRAQFRRVYETGRKVVRHSFVLFVLGPDQLEADVEPAAAIGIVASRKVGGAVARSRAKRVLRAAMAPLSPQLQGPYWIVCVARRNIVEAGVRSQAIEPELSASLEELGAFAPGNRPASTPLS